MYIFNVLGKMGVVLNVYFGILKIKKKKKKKKN